MSLEKAFALAGLGFSVFPVNPATKMPYKGTSGHLDATSDTEAIATMWGEHSDAAVGVNAGESEVICLDIDIDESKNGFDSLGFLDIPETYSYTTQSGRGRHFVYDFSTPLPPSNRYRKMQGVDRKSGSSYFIFYGDVPASRDVFAMPPEWLLDFNEGSENFAEGFAGDVSDWLEQVPQGEPTPTVMEIIETLPTSGFGHAEVISITYRLVRLAAEGHTGIDWAYEQLWSTWVRGEWDTPALRKELYDAIEGAVRKAGAEDHAIAELPDYSDVLERVSAKLLSILTAPANKTSYFAGIKMALAEGFSVSETASLIWSAPSTKIQAREWTIAFLMARIEEAAAEAEVVVSGPGPEEQQETVDSNVSLLSADEREAISTHATTVDRFVYHAGTRVPKQNGPYDRINAWTFLSATLCSTGFIPRKNGRAPLNMFCMTLGETTTGKSESKKWLMECLRESFPGDPGFNIGGNGSPNALAEHLVARDGQMSFFNKDEAHGALKIWTDPKNWATGLLEDLAEYYDGKVPPHLFKNSKETSGKSADTFFCMHLMGTPKAMIGTMSRELFGTGFLARFQWAIGEPREITYDGMAEEDDDGTEAMAHFDPAARAFAVEIAVAKRLIRQRADSDRVAVRIDRAAAKRLQDAKWALSTQFQNDRNWDILQPSLIRMGVTIRKAASLIAMSEARTTIVLNDILIALEAAEEWISNLVIIAGQIVESDWQRGCDEIEEYLISRGGEVKREMAVRRFKALETRIFTGYVDSLVAQGRVREFTGENKNRYLAVVKEGE